MLNDNEILLRLGLAVLFGSLIGFERERKHWAAGLRTHTMVCVGSTLIMMVSSFGFIETATNQHAVYDPSRVAAQVVSGIGFIGAGTILFLKRGIIRGLTTAAGLWTVAAIGLAVGGGMYFAASTTTAIALLILWGMKPIERKYFKKSTERTLRISLIQYNDIYLVFQQLNHFQHLNIRRFDLNNKEEECVVEIQFDDMSTTTPDEILQKLTERLPIKGASWIA